ncbi:hypothetical protein L0337_00695 [candidate division KSB1 bacterium]|nr:hypothetical protein [candidate division KSB1 bacterium]
MSQKSVSELAVSSPWPAETLGSAVLPLQEDNQTEWLEKSAAIQQDRHEKIRQKTAALFAAATDQRFEDGMESEFSNELVALVEEHGDAAVQAIAHLIISEIVSAEVAAEALRWFGRMDHMPTHNARLWLLERSLFCSSAQVRDGAALGLAAMDDPHAIAYLKQAIQREKHPALREDLKQVLTQLETTEQCR